MSKSLILISDWKAERAQQLIKLFDADYFIQQVTDPQEMIRFIRKQRPDLVILPLRWPSSQNSIPEKSFGFTLVDQLEGSTSPLKLILFDDQLHTLLNSEYCYPFLKGAIAFLDEADPAFMNRLKSAVCKSVLERPEAAEDRRRVSFEGLGLVGQSAAMRRIRESARKAAFFSDLPVLITGASGTGKELIARAIHQMDPKRSGSPFIAVNCSAISGMLAESEFFGHRRGAFTGADRDRLGLFRAAEGGVLFLDEISELDLKLQPKLLRVLQERRILPVGQESEQLIDVRVIAATNKDLPASVAQGHFRMDLFQRLNVLSLEIPELKQRKEDIRPLVYFFLKKHRSCYRGQIQEVHPRVMELLQTLNYDGNVRELENIVRKILFRKSDGEIIEMVDLPPELLRHTVGPSLWEEEEAFERFLFGKIQSGLSFQETIGLCERMLLKAAFEETGGQRSKMAALLKVTLRTLFNKMQRHGPTKLESPVQINIRAASENPSAHPEKFLSL
ncbi:MAG: sigma-54-dependent Fis family transcriptional regulator [Nitrospirae bacterium]|nr:sigma-54-dependent Fis family transcriptional regulator [Candidatus Manganitrophaceae bacterium]